MTPEEYRMKDFPVHHELGDNGPVVELGEVADMIGDRGCMLVDFERGDDGQIRIKTLCLPKDAEEMGEDDEPEDLEEALNRAEKQARLKKMDDIESDDGDEIGDDE